MLTTYFSFYNEKICFKEITFKPRQAGTNSINIPRIVKIGWNALGDFAGFKKGMKKRKHEEKKPTSLEVGRPRFSLSFHFHSL